MQKYPEQNRFNWNQMWDANPRILYRKKKAIKVKKKGKTHVKQPTFHRGLKESSVRHNSLKGLQAHCLCCPKAPGERERTVARRLAPIPGSSC